MRELEQYRKAMQALPLGCTAAEAEAEKQEKLSVEVTGRKTGRMSCSEQTELFVRASGERTGLVYTQKLDADPQQVLAQALENSRISAGSRAEPMVTPEDWEDAVCSSEPISLVPVEVLKDKALELAGRLQDRLEEQAAETGEKSLQVRLELAQVIQTMGVVNSLGTDQTAVCCRYTAEVTAGGYSGYRSALRLEELTPEPFLRELRQRRIVEQPVIPAEPGTYRAVLSSDAVNNILITAWQMFTARRAQSASTPFAGKVGQQIFSPCITIRDYKGGADSKNSVLCGFSWGMDCEGVPSRDRTLAEGGVLKGWMHNLSTAGDAKVTSTGNAGRRTLLSGNIHTDMLIMPKNFTIESGSASLEELLQACGDGVYIFENYDQFHALNVVSGDFSFPCKAVRIRDGKPAGLMEGLTMSGNVAELMSQVELLGRDRVICPLVMYDSYTVSGPAMLVGGLRISG